ncbi:hypothetical protein OPV22_019156 [Ensete ventricosum]|uniref:Uncharacterized protein n=1 Tax=Ensete ventricosum TaxID=4639 RepID=A0AAV8PGJ2_ENSVE|nr:hypothetical protein OPV22_019156 [Ensete ventricosum]
MLQRRKEEAKRDEATRAIGCRHPRVASSGGEAIVEEGKESDGDGEGSGGDRHSGDGEVPEERGAPRFEIHSFGP